MAQNFEKNGGKKHNKLVTFLKKIFPSLRKLEIGVNQTVSSNLISVFRYVVFIPLIIMKFQKGFQKEQHKICIPQNL